MNSRIFVSAMLLIFTSQPVAIAQVTGPRTPEGCIRVSDPESKVSVSGRLTLQLFPGAPNFESIAAGDAEERTFIVELPLEACIDDGGDFADPAEKFVTVQVSGAQDRLSAVLKAAVGYKVTIEGEGFASHTGHHHAPLVVIADRVSVE
ncbi:MAG: DUF4431 domain-containing protein [Sphingomonas sp.]|uniref:DUF4431 domain-containing protein n=1 Tax=Sphingomonas sp. TaxID=28214 RepID=UPI00261CF7F0|nr:DUF4431 domain-containing protein [Sphingomonas sp.]MDK2770382.1 DUF4431 domain-containing protein [Sphingomonas sp.]